MLRTNLTGPFLRLRAAIAHLIETRGSVVAVASVAALRNGVANAAYATSKAALLQLCRSVAVDYGKRGVRPNTVCPSCADRDGRPAHDPLRAGGRPG